MALPKPEPSNSIGFEAIGGLDESCVYAVGWEGEIWCWNGSAWHRASRRKASGRRRDLILTGVTVAPDGTGYACGQGGTLLRGDGDVWSFVDTTGIVDDFWDVEWHDDRLYVASFSGVYHLSDAGLAPVDFGDDIPSTCRHLTAAQGVLWSVGAADVFSLAKGQWHRID